MKLLVLRLLVFIMIVAPILVSGDQVSAAFLPAPNIKVQGDQNESGIYYGDVEIQLDGNAEYSLDSGNSWKTYSSPIILVPPKGYSLQYRTAGSTNYSTMDFAVKKDVTAPLTTFELGNNDDDLTFSKGSIQFKLSAVDYESGVASTQYSLDKGQNWLDYTGAVTITDDSISKIYYRSIDKSKNIEKSRQSDILLDNIPPESPHIYLDNRYWTSENVAVKIHDGIDENSGVARTEYSFSENGPWIVYSKGFVVDKEQLTIYARTIDKAGNISDVAMSTPFIDRTPPNAPIIDMNELWQNTSIVVTVDNEQDLMEHNSIRYQYKFNNTEEWNEYISQFFIDTLGETSIDFRSFDEAGNYSPVVNKTARFDNIAPTEPTDFKVANLRYNRFDLSWSGATDNIGINGYDIYTDDDQFITTVADATYRFTGLQANTTYKFKVVTYDNAYNESGFSKTIEVTTHSRPDFQASDSSTMVALRGDGTVWTWGNGRDGALGDGTKVTRSIPKPLANFKNVKSIFTGNGITLAQKVDGSVWGWGGYPINSTIPVEVPSLNKAKQIYIRNQTIFIVQNDNRLWGWGKGTLYGSYNAELAKPIDLGLSDVKKVDIQKEHILVLNNQGTMWTWGSPSSDLLGNSRPTNTYYPFALKMSNLKAANIATGQWFDLVLNDTGTIDAWGYDGQGQLGNSRNNNFLKPSPALTFRGGVTVVRSSASGEAGDYREINNIRDIAIGENQALAIDNNDELWGWGSNVDGLLMYNAKNIEENGIIYQAEKLNVSNVKEIIAHTPYESDTYFTLVLKKNNQLVGWGNNKNSVLGTKTTLKVPPAILANDVDKAASRGGEVTFTKDDETFWMLGNRSWDGNNYSAYTSPVQVDFNNEAVPPGDNTPAPIIDEAPEQPSDISLKESGTTTATINWMQNEDKVKVKEYRIFVDGKQVGTSTTKTYTLTALQPGQKYVVTVEAVSETEKVSKSSDPLNIDTAIDVPSKPANVKVKSSTMHTVDLVWDKSNSASAIKEYVIYQDGVEIGRTSNLAYSIKNLRSGTTYKYSIQSVNDAGKESEQSEVVPAALPSDIPTTPASLTISKPVDGMATATWNTSTSQGTIQKYIVQINGEVAAETVETKYSLQSMTKDKSYTISVTAVTEEGVSSSPALLILPAAPTNLTATDIDMYTKNLSWEIPDSQKSSIKMYKVYLNDALYKSTSDTSVELELLVPGKAYKVQVTAISNTDTESQWSDSLEISTVASPLLKKFIFSMSGSAGWIKKNGDLWVWGTNVAGNLGDGTTISKTNAVQLNIKNVKQISIGGLLGRGVYTLAVTEDGKLWGWGTSYDHAIGDLSPSAEVPKLITLHSQPVNDVVAVTTIPNMNYILKTDGTVWSFGAPSSDLKRVEGLTSIIQIVGEYALKSDGTVWKYSNYEAIQLKGLSEIKQITTEYGLKTDGTVWKWTFKDNTKDIVLQQVPGLSQIIRVEAGNGHIVALKQNGSVWTFGSNSSGQLGIGTIDDPKLSTQHSVAVEVQGLRNVIDVSAGGSSSFAVQADGTAWGWGFNYEGRLGDGTTIDRPSPVKVVENTPPTVKLLEMGESALSAKSMTNPKVTFKWEQKDNAVNTVFNHFQIQVLDEKGQKILDSGELEQDKDQTITNLASWISKQDLPRSMTLQAQVRVKDSNLWSEWSQSGWFSVIAEPSTPKVFSLTREMAWVKADGSVWMWGKNDSGQLGDGTTTNQLNAIPINIQNVKQIFNGGTYSLALKTDGSVWGWGRAFDASFGPIDDRIKTPFSIVTANEPLKDIQQIGYRDGSNYILKNDGTVWYYGNFSELRQVPNLKSVTQIIRDFAVKSDGTVWKFTNSYAEQLPELTDIQKITEYHVLKKDGTVWNWRYDQFTKKTTLDQITVLKDITQLEDYMALRKDGSVWTWGSNPSGQIGNGTTTSDYTPAPVKGLSEVISISSNRLSLIALQADGTAWSWGLNDQGQLGDGTKINRLVPVRVLENTPPIVKMLDLGTTADSPVIKTNPRGDFEWEQTDSMSNTVFSDMQIQVLNEAGEKVADSGEMKQDKAQMVATTGSWLTNQDLPENLKLQVQVRVKDGSMWSEWSEPGWFIVKTEVKTIITPRVFHLNRTMGWIKNDGSLWMWGDNMYGQLGDGTGTSRTEAIPVNTNDIKQVVDGGSYIVALKTDGSLWGWGTTTGKELSLNNVDKQVPKPIAPSGQPITGIQQITANSVLKKDGTVWYFNGTSGLREVANLNDVSQIYLNYAVKKDGAVRYINNSSQNIPELTNVLQITANHVLKKDGTVWKWSYNDSTKKTTISQVIGLTQIVQVQDGAALKKDGTVWTWGSNAAGQLGDGTNTSRDTPAQVQGLDQVTSISSNGYSVIALQTDGTAWTWGSNAQGRLGDGTTIDRNRPVKVVDNTPPTAKLLEMGESAQNPSVLNNSRFTFNWEQKDNIANTVFTDMHIKVLDEQGQQVLDSGELKQYPSQKMTGIGSWIASQEFSENVKYQVRVRVKDGSAWSDWSQPGWFIVKLEVDSSPTPSPAVFSLDFKMGWVKADGTVWMWGQNESGQLGNGTTTDQPQAVRTYIRNVKQLAGGDKYTLALKTDGTLWGWGTTSDASLGEGLANKKMPGRIIIGGQPLKNIQQIVSLSGVNYVLKNDGTVWYFGQNSDLRQVPNLTSISQLSRLAALKSDGTVWQYDTTSAKVVSELTNVQQLMSSTILKKDGTVWQWWYNYSTKKFNVTQVSGLTQVTQIQNGMAVKKDGSLWTWGDNVYGQLADGTQKYREAAAQVKGISKVVSISNNARSVVALQEDGTAWSWAENNYGQLGDGTTTNRLVPVKVITSK